MDDLSQQIQDNMGLVYTLVNQLYPQYIHDDNIIEIATISLWKALQTFDESKKYSFSSYLKKIIKNDIFNEIKRNCKKNKVEFSLDSAISDKSNNTKIINVEDNKLYAMLLVKEYDTTDVIHTLTDKQKEIYQLMLECLTQQEISETLGVSQTYVNKLIKKIRRKVAREWQI